MPSKVTPAGFLFKNAILPDQQLTAATVTSAAHPIDVCMWVSAVRAQQGLLCQPKQEPKF